MSANLQRSGMMVQLSHPSRVAARAGLQAACRLLSGALLAAARPAARLAGCKQSEAARLRETVHQ